MSMRQLLANRMKELHVPGVNIAVIHEGKIEWARVTADTMFQAASISKPLAAMAALRMVQEGKLSLDGDGNTYLSSWRFPADPGAVGKSLTLRELLTLAAGTTVRAFPGYATNDAVRAV
jgi:CubicO group peptidase (beta-lactamase class C family)